MNWQPIKELPIEVKQQKLTVLLGKRYPDGTDKVGTGYWNSAFDGAHFHYYWHSSVVDPSHFCLIDPLP